MKKTVTMSSYTIWPMFVVLSLILQFVFSVMSFELAGPCFPPSVCCTSQVHNFLVAAISIGLYLLFIIIPVLPIMLTVLSKRLRKGVWYSAAHWLLWLIILYSVIGINLRIHCRTPQSIARRIGVEAQLAQEDHYKEIGGEYTDRLSDLMSYDWDLTYDPDVTFIFGSCNTTGYTFTTVHKECDCEESMYIYTDKSKGR